MPNYRVSAKGDTLNIALAPAGGDKVAKKDAAGGHAGKHAKHEHKKAEKN